MLPLPLRGLPTKKNVGLGIGSITRESMGYSILPRMVYVVAVITVLIGCMGVGSGFVNGDAVVYAHQAMTGDWASRITHVGYIFPTWLLALGTGEYTPVLMDLFSAIAAGFAVVSAAKIGAKIGGNPTIVAGLTFVGVLPLASSAEVDIVWFAMLLYATVAPRWAAVLFTGWAVAISPLAVLALPWAMVIRGAVYGRRARGSAFELALGAVIGVIVLTLLSSGAWWFGDRGVLVATDAFEYREVVHRWTHGVGLTYVAVCAICLVHYSRVVVPSIWLAVLLSFTMLAAPPDTAGYLPLLISLALLAGFSRPSMRLIGAGFVVVSMLFAVGEWSRRVARVEAENTLAQHIAQRITDADGLIATWSWGVRVSWYRDGNPYGDWWRVPGSTLRQQHVWCQRSFQRVANLPAGREYMGSGQKETDEFGVVWSVLPAGTINSHELCVE